MGSNPTPQLLEGVMVAEYEDCIYCGEPIKHKNDDCLCSGCLEQINDTHSVVYVFAIIVIIISALVFVSRF